MAVKTNIQKLENARVQELCTTLSEAHSKTAWKSLFSCHTAFLYPDVTARDACITKPFFLLQYSRLREVFRFKTKYRDFIIIYRLLSF